MKSVESKEITLDNALQISNEKKEIAFELDAMLSSLEEDAKTREIVVRFHKLYSIGQNSAKNTELQKEYGKLYIKYIAFDRLKKRYFYDS